MSFRFTRPNQRLFEINLNTKNYSIQVNLEIMKYQFLKSKKHSCFYQFSTNFWINILKFKFIELKLLSADHLGWK